MSLQARQGNKVVGSHGNGELVAITMGKEGNRKGFVLLSWGFGFIHVLESEMWSSLDLY